MTTSEKDVGIFDVVFQDSSSGAQACRLVGSELECVVLANGATFTVTLQQGYASTLAWQSVTISTGPGTENLSIDPVLGLVWDPEVPGLFGGWLGKCYRGSAGFR